MAEHISLWIYISNLAFCIYIYIYARIRKERLSNVGIVYNPIHTILIICSYFSLLDLLFIRRMSWWSANSVYMVTVFTNNKCVYIYFFVASPHHYSYHHMVIMHNYSICIYILRTLSLYYVSIVH